MGRLIGKSPDEDIDIAVRAENRRRELWSKRLSGTELQSRKEETSSDISNNPAKDEGQSQLTHAEAGTGASNDESLLAGTSNLQIQSQADPSADRGSLKNDVQPSLDMHIDPPRPSSPDPIPSWSVSRFTPDELTDAKFEYLWHTGEPLLVEGLLPKFKLQWTPSYFEEKYGQQNCLILECQLDTNKRVTVGNFFSQFGKYEGRTECWKLKDWPPSADFRTTFPELYADFNDVVPVPSYSRRDGAFNIASHFPSGTVAPDLGPKMYNAFASNEATGSKGSTRLHMDMADAVNIMMYSEPTPTGEVGCAAWDIFRVEDSDKIRLFLKKHFRGNQNDPIHAQSFYLDPTLRKQLYDEHDVKSYRFYQKPGEAVFIPAGCAHQVCNLADCIKVACDFVSLDSVERCEVLTREFRDQNQAAVWKEDVLQLRSMMWYAWMSCRRMLPGHGATDHEDAHMKIGMEVDNRSDWDEKGTS